MEKIVAVTAVTGNYPDGQKIDKAIVKYSCPLSVDLSAQAFAVEDRTVTAVKVEGDSVIISLNIREEAAGLIPKPKRPKPAPGEKPSGPPRGGMPVATRRAVQVTVTQVEAITAADGSVILPDGISHVSDRAVEPVVEEFAQFVFNDIPYNLYTPKNLEAGKVYPLVMYIHDAGPCGPDPKITLSQGCGAVSFADPAWQGEHPCFVLAPQIDRRIKLTNDGFTCAKELEDIKAMVDYVADSNPVDKNRIYATGQSMGCMASCELNIRYPGYFAASLLVAGQWDPQKMADTYCGNQYWILVSEHDAKAFPGMNAVTEAIEAAGVQIGRYRWDGKAPAEELTQLAREAMKEDYNVRYTVFNGSTVVPEWEDDNPGSNHMCTWPVVYQIAGLKEWLFSHSK